MATSGNFTGSTSNKYITPKIEWSCEQSVTGNYSNVTATLYYKKSSSSTSSTYGTLKCSLTINGNKKSSEISSFDIPANDTYQKAMSHTVKVPHNADGTKSVVISCTGYISGTTLESTTCKKTVELTTIPRTSTVTASSANIGAACTISIKRASSSFTHTLKYTFGNLSGTIATKTNAISVEWLLPTSFYAEMGTVKSMKGIISCITYNGDTAIGTSTTNFTANVSDSNAPSLNPKVYVSTSSDTYALTGSTTKLIRYYTWASYEINATAKNGATIASQSMSNGDLVYINSSGQMNKPIVTNKFIFSAEDSRGYSTVQEYIADVVEYVKVTCSIRDVSFSSDGKISFTVKGNYYNGSFGAQSNSLTVKYRYKKNNDSYSAWQSVTATKSGNSYYANVSLTGLSYQDVYTIQAAATDKLSTVYSGENSLSCYPVFDWGKNDFNFNVPIRIQGNDMADFVIEQGSSGIWTYVKWNSGRAEAFGRLPAGGINIETALGSWFRCYSIMSFSDYAYPFTFVAVPNVTVSFSTNNSKGALVWITKDSTTSLPPECYLIRPTAETSVSGYINLHAIGRWK